MTVKSFFFKYFLKNSFMYLVAPALSCGMWDFQLQQERSSSPSRDQTQGRLHWECGVLATGPPGKFLDGQIFTNAAFIYPLAPCLFPDSSILFTFILHSF